MKKHKILIALAALALFSATACGEVPHTDPPIPPDEDNIQEEIELTDISEEFALEEPSGHIKAGETLTLNMISLSNRSVTVNWTSSDSSVLTVNNGTVSGVGKGTATVTAEISAEGCETLTLSCQVEVKPADYTLVPLENFIMITDYVFTDVDKVDILNYILTGGRDMISGLVGEDFRIKKRTSSQEESPYELIVGETAREESFGAGSDLGDGEYSVRSVLTEEGMKVLVNANDAYAMAFAYEFLASKIIVTEEGAFVPSDLDVKAKPHIFQEDYTEIMIETDTSFVRDPCIVSHEGLYYMIGSGFDSTGYGVATSEDLVHWSAPVPVSNFSEIPDYAGDCWAPEMHFYEGNYYITATYKSSETGFRGCAIFKADTPKGPFHMITDGHLTSPEWNAIDATLYVDENGDPWFVYVREWVTAPNEVGTFEAARLSDDLTHLVSEPVELFKADEPYWACHTVTDGCWFYEMESTGSLIMLWSNFDPAGYCIAMARSTSGNILGPWEQIDTRLYSAVYSGAHAGGHGSIFKTAEGQLMVSFHCPNDDYEENGMPHAFLMPIEEDPVNDMLVPKK